MLLSFTAIQNSHRVSSSACHRICLMIISSMKFPASEFGSLVSWFQKLSSEEPFAKAVSVVTKGNGVEAFKVIWSCHCSETF